MICGFSYCKQELFDVKHARSHAMLAHINLWDLNPKKTLAKVLNQF